MKKLLAILLSALMLCAMIPFGTVAAAEGDPIVQLSIVDELESVNAGDEFQVEVNFLNLEDTAGLISALVEIGFDSDAFELVTYFDEDEEMWMPPIEIGSKYNASSNKYIMFSPIDEETGFMERCLVKYMRATATANQVRREEHFFTVTFKVKDDAVSGTYDLTAIQYDGLWHGTVEFQFATENTSIVVNGLPAGCEHEYDNACDANCNLCDEIREVADHSYVDGVCSACGAADPNYVPPCQHEYFYACDPVCMLCYELTNPDAAHSMSHVEYKAPTCTENGNIEYWTCEYCGGCWDNENATGMPLNRMSVILSASCKYDAVYHEGVEAGCHYKGQTDYWYCANCDVFYADADCTIVTNYLNTIIPALQDTAEYVPAKTPTCTENGNTEYWYCYDCEQVWADEALTQLSNLKNMQIAPSCKYGAEYIAAKDANCFEQGNIEHWYCANCDVVYADADCTIITNFKNVILPVTHNIVHQDAVTPTCTELGNIEFWYCDICGSAWADEALTMVTNMMSVKLAPSCKYGAEYVAAKDANCFEQGNVEYWYCANCDVVYADADCTIITNFKNVILPVSHNVIHVEYKAPACTENGNIEYWYCETCGSAWLDELCIYNTNLKAVILPAAGHTYTNAHDASCDVCSEIREIVLPATEIILDAGNSITEELGGLAFKFDVAVDGIEISENYIADYTNATVTIDGVEYKLVKMGAIANNKGYANQTLENVDGTYVLDIPAEKVFGDYSYAVRIINIPAEHLDTEITVCSYYTYECEGELITIYGEDWATSYNAELNG